MGFESKESAVVYKTRLYTDVNLEQRSTAKSSRGAPSREFSSPGKHFFMPVHDYVSGDGVSNVRRMIPGKLPHLNKVVRTKLKGCIWEEDGVSTYGSVLLL